MGLMKIVGEMVWDAVGTTLFFIAVLSVVGSSLANLKPPWLHLGVIAVYVVVFVLQLVFTSGRVASAVIGGVIAGVMWLLLTRLSAPLFGMVSELLVMLIVIIITLVSSLAGWIVFTLIEEKLG